MRVAVIGAGPAGMTAAYVLAKAGVDVEVFEASDSVGGLAKTIRLWDQLVDIGPHRFFSNDTRVNKLWLEVAGNDYHMVDRLTRIYYKKRFFFYPLKPFNALCTLGLWEACVCLASYAKARLFPPPDAGTFESWVVRRFGRRLFEIFFKSYTEKLWGISCQELNADFAAQRIKKMSLWEAIKNAISHGKGNTHKTLVDQFAYPMYGTGMVYQRMADYVTLRGGQVHCKTPIRRVITQNNTVIGIELDSGEVKAFDHVISTMPLTLMVSRLEGLPGKVKEATGGLKYRNTVLVYLHVDGKDLFPDNWLYIHSADLTMGRLTNFRNWVPELYGDKDTTIMALEYWCYDTDPMWQQDDPSMIDLASRELRATGLIADASIVDGHVYRIPRCYPVYDNGYKERLAEVQTFLDGIAGLSVIGRYGAFKYNNQDHSILMGLLAAENIVQGTQHDLWRINTDYEDYQEASLITKTGLVQQH